MGEMTDKNKALQTIRAYIQSGIVTEDDIRAILTTKSPSQTEKNDKLSAVDVMFYIAGFVFFAAIMSLITQSWNTGEGLLHIFLSAGIGAIVWMVAFMVARRESLSDVQNGMVDALLLTGTLLIVVGGYIIANEIVNGYDDVNFIPAAVAFAIVGAVHVGFDRLVKRNLVLLMGIFTAVLAFPSFMFGLLKDANAPVDVWTAVVILSAGLLAFGTRVVAKIYADRKGIERSFDGLAAFVALLAMYIASYSDNEGLWFILLIISVLTVFYLCIVFQSKNLLGIASLFLVLTVITISFRYFSDYGVSVSLIVATVGLLGSAAVATTINKKYIKSPSQND